MPGIVTPLESYYNINILSQEVNDFAFPFITPLSSYYNYIAHILLSPINLMAFQGD
jgi:hypothetical protein